jgi:hypothetical protein
MRTIDAAIEFIIVVNRIQGVIDVDNLIDLGQKRRRWRRRRRRCASYHRQWHRNKRGRRRPRRRRWRQTTRRRPSISERRRGRGSRRRTHRSERRRTRCWHGRSMRRFLHDDDRWRRRSKVGHRRALESGRAKLLRVAPRPARTNNDRFWPICPPITRHAGRQRRRCRAVGGGVECGGRGRGDARFYDCIGVCIHRRVDGRSDAGRRTRRDARRRSTHSKCRQR